MERRKSRHEIQCFCIQGRYEHLGFYPEIDILILTMVSFPDWRVIVSSCHATSQRIQELLGARFLNVICRFCRLLSFYFSKLTSLKIFFQEHYQSVNRFGSRSGQTIRLLDMGPNGLQRLSADDKSCHQQRKS